MHHVRMIQLLMIIAAVAANATGSHAAAATLDQAVTLADEGEARVVIYAPADVMRAKDVKWQGRSWYDIRPEAQKVRLRESVKDLARCLSAIAGTKIDVVSTAPKADDTRLPILIGELARAKYGDVRQTDTSGQGGRYVVTTDGIGLYGESDLAASYMIYEMLHRLGARWYIPSEMGEVLPSHATMTVPLADGFIVPSTLGRSIWFCDDDYGRRNRMGGMYLAAGHALEGYMDPELLKEHPEWRAVDKNGHTAHRRLRWSMPGVAEALAQGAIRRLDTLPAVSLSLSPDDGLGFDMTEDTKWDAADWDASVGDWSITDRQVKLSNILIERINEKHPGIMYGMLAYGQSTRPPKREMPHEQLIPQIAPITYRRAHPMTYDGVPGNEALRDAITGWARVSPKISYYFYSWFLAEPAAPSPFITKWAEDLRFIYDHGNCAFWQPESMATFDANMHALYMGLRMSWDSSQNPYDIIDELHETYYAEAGPEMAEYWHAVDRVWTDVPEYAGAGYGHLNRWVPERLARVREKMNAAIKAATETTTINRVRLSELNLSLFEDFMAVRRDFVEGRWDRLGYDADAYAERAKTLAERYSPQYAFGKADYLKDRVTWYFTYFRAFYKRTYDDAARVHAKFDVMTGPLREWAYRFDPRDEGVDAAWHATELGTTNWRTTDVAVDTWSSLGHHNYLGDIYYRKTITAAGLDPQLDPARRQFLWIGATDGRAKVYINGEHVPYVNAKGETVEQFDGFASAASFDITDQMRSAAQGDGTIQITIHAERHFINELGTGGLLAPVVLYQTRGD